MMRRAIVVSIAAVVLLAAGGVQEAQAQSVRLGVKGGIVWSELSDDAADPDVTLGRRSGWAGGAFFRLGGGGITVQVEGLYVRRGAELTGEGLDSELTLDYLEVPLLLRVTSQRVRFSPHLFLGPYAAFQIDAMAEIRGGDDVIEQDISDQFEDLDYGAIVGAGLEFGSVGIEARYTLGLQDLAVDAAAPGELKHRSLSLLASITF